MGLTHPANCLFSQGLTRYEPAMAQHRRLSDHALLAARLEYEGTPISERALAAKYGVARPSLKAWIVRQGWTKAEDPYRYDGAVGQQLLQHDIRTALRQMDDRTIVACLAAGFAHFPASKPAGRFGKPATPGPFGHPGAAAAGDPGRSSGERPKPRTLPPDQGAGGTPVPDGRRGGIGRFPGPDQAPFSRKIIPATRAPAPVPVPPPVPPSSPTQPGEGSERAIALLERQAELLRDFQHLFAVYFNPARYLDTTGLDPEQAAETLAAVSHAAGRRLMPGRRDTLAGTMQVLNKAVLTTFAARREAADWAVRRQAAGGSSPEARASPGKRIRAR